MQINYIFSIIIILAIYLIDTNGQTIQKSMSLSEKVQNLMEMNAKRSILKFNGQKFREYVRQSPRNYSVIVMLTALAPSRQCSICRLAHDEYQIVANSYRYSSVYSNKLFFVMVDFDEGSDVFRMLGLDTAPVFLHFPPKTKAKAADRMDPNRMGISAEAISKFIQSRTDIQIRVFRPSSYSSTLAVFAVLALLAGFLYYRRNNLEFLYNKQLWGSLALLFCFAMISGQMWNHIRDPPILQKTANGIAYIYASSQAQLVIETYIVMFLNCVIVLGMIILIESGSQSDMRKGRLMAIIGLIMVAVFFSFLLSVFRSKAHGYPYSFLFK